MPRREYDKPALLFEEQLNRLKDRGLTVDNELKALHILQNISYFRLSGYWYPFLKEPESEHSFKEKLDGLLEKYPDVDISAIGFPEDWKTYELWK